MWSNNFPNEDVIGFFNVKHYLIIVVYLVLAIYLAFKLKEISHIKIKKILVVTAFTLTFAELIKDLNIIFDHGQFRSWFQLAYCSLFLPALWMILFKNKFINKLGAAYLVIGGIVGGVFYIFVPNGSIDVYPLYHIKTLHGIIYHFLMVFTGLLCLFSKYYEIKRSDFKYYFIFMTGFTVLAVVVNLFFDCHALFLNDPSGIKILTLIYDASPLFYAILVYLFEAIFAFFGIYYGYVQIKKIISWKFSKEEVTNEYE